jgi:hypothetical protein
VSTNSAFTSFVSGYSNRLAGTVTTKSVTGLSAERTYYYRVRAQNAGGTSGDSDTIAATTLPLPPLAPVALPATSLTTSGFQANWEAVAGATGYRLDVATDSGFSSFVSGFQNRSVGDVTGYTVTGLASDQTYYYRVRAGNSGGTSGHSGAIAATTLAAPPLPPTALAATSVAGTSFYANWSASAGATTYFLDVALDSGFTSFVAGYSNRPVGNVTTRAVTGLSAGQTCYYRVRAQNAVGTSGNSGTITVTMSLENVCITNLVSSTASGVATVVVATTHGVLYGVHVAEVIPDQGAPTWTPMMTGQTGDGSNQAMTDMEAAGLVQRFYQVALAGHEPSPDNIWGVVRKTANVGYTLITPPVRTDRRVDGAMGRMLAEPLAGDDSAAGDRIFIMESGGGWRTLYLDSQKVWREENGDPSTYVLPAGAGFFVERRGGGAIPITFTGPVGNAEAGSAEVHTNRLVSGWNMIGLSEGKTLTIKDTFQEANPVGGASKEEADQIVLQNPDGSWKWLMYVQGWGPPYDGNWFDLQTFTIVTNQLEPGAGYYYFRQPSGGPTDVKF